MGLGEVAQEKPQTEKRTPLGPWEDVENNQEMRPGSLEAKEREGRGGRQSRLNAEKPQRL